MKSPLARLLVFLAALALVACKPSRVEGPPPNPVGTWQWSNDLLGSWKLEIKPDGTFQRQVTTPFSRNPATIQGQWSLGQRRTEPTLLERLGLFQKTSEEEELLRSAGIDPAQRASIQWSEGARLIFQYYAAPGTELAPGAVWTGESRPTAASDDKAGTGNRENGIVEAHDIHTYTTQGGSEVFLTLDGKTFRQSSGATVDQALPKVPASPAPETPAKTETAAAAEKASPALTLSTPPAALSLAPAAPNSTPVPDFLAVEPFPGITVEVPHDWEVADPNAKELGRAPITGLVGKPRPPKPNASARFTPPGQVQDVYVFVSILPTIFTPQQLADSSDSELDRFAAGFVKGASHSLETKGYLLDPHVTADRVKLGERPAIRCTAEMKDVTGSRFSLRAFAIPTESATIMLSCCYDLEPGKPWKPIIERACSTFRIADTFRLP